MPTVPGFQPGNATKVASAQDTLAPAGDRDKIVTREILVDRNDDTKSLVYLWLFTT